MGQRPSQKFGTQQISKIKILKIKIHVAQNVGKVWIGRKQTFPAPFGAIPGNFVRGPEKLKKCDFVSYFPWWANGPHSPGLGPFSNLPQHTPEFCSCKEVRDRERLPCLIRTMRAQTAPSDSAHESHWHQTVSLAVRIVVASARMTRPDPSTAQKT